MEGVRDSRNGEVECGCDKVPRGKLINLNVKMGTINYLHDLSVVLIGLAVRILKRNVHFERVLDLGQVQVPLHQVPVGPGVARRRVDEPPQSVQHLQLRFQNRFA